MRVLFDGAIFNRSFGRPFGGVARYFKHLIEGLPPEARPIMALNENNIPIYPRPDSVKTYRFCARNMRPYCLIKPLEELFSKHFCGVIGADIFHPTNHLGLDGTLIRHGKQPMVVTVYDMIHELFPETMDPDGWFRRHKEAAYRQGDVLLAISEVTRQDLARIHNIPLERIVVTHLAGDLGHTVDLATAPGRFDHPYLLYVGDRALWHKNFVLIAQALRALGKNAPPCVAAGPHWSADESRDYADLIKAGKLISTGRVTDNDLAVLYRDALAFICPSHYEGFGIPPLEAMILGAPVLATDRGSVPEVVGDAALSFSPNEPEQLEAHIRTIIEDSDLRANLIQRGHERARMFTWENTVQRTMEAYRGLI